MAKVDLSNDLIELVRRRSENRCEYCQTAETLSGVRCQIDHIIPRSRQGRTTEDNLCLACAACNGHKHARTAALDLETGALEPLFHPRRQRWEDHFAWSADGAEVVGLTATGRATVTALRMNDSLITSTRALWVSIGLHPPKSTQ